MKCSKNTLPNTIFNCEDEIAKLIFTVLLISVQASVQDFVLYISGMNMYFYKRSFRFVISVSTEVRKLLDE